MYYELVADAVVGFADEGGDGYWVVVVDVASHVCELGECFVVDLFDEDVDDVFVC